MTKADVTRWAILGTGPVAHKFLAGLKALGSAAQVTQIASRRSESAQAFGKQYGVPAAADYASALSAADVDAVYIAVPPAAHEYLALAAIAAGKAVLIEKPVAIDGNAARRIAAAADAAGVFCMEAMWTRFLPLISKAKERVESGDIGEPRSLTGSFGIPNQPDSGASLFDPMSGGGALMHRGFYAVSLARTFLGPVKEVFATARLGESGVDEDCAIVLHHECGAISTLTASLRALATNDLTVSGTHGRLTLGSPIYRPFSATLVTTTPRKEMHGAGRIGALRESALAQALVQRLPVRGKIIRAYYKGNGYHYQAAEVARCLAAGTTSSPLMPMTLSIEVMDILDKARASFK